MLISIIYADLEILFWRKLLYLIFLTLSVFKLHFWPCLSYYIFYVYLFISISLELLHWFIAPTVLLVLSRVMIYCLILFNPVYSCLCLNCIRWTLMKFPRFALSELAVRVRVSVSVWVRVCVRVMVGVRMKWKSVVTWKVAHTYPRALN